MLHSVAGHSHHSGNRKRGDSFCSDLLSGKQAVRQAMTSWYSGICADGSWNFSGTLPDVPEKGDHAGCPLSCRGILLARSTLAEGKPEGSCGKRFQSGACIRRTGLSCQSRRKRNEEDAAGSQNLAGKAINLHPDHGGTCHGI